MPRCNPQGNFRDQIVKNATFARNIFLLHTRDFSFLRGADMQISGMKDAIGRALATASEIMCQGQSWPDLDETSPQTETGSGRLHLRILATSDLHANILAWDYHANKICPSRGLARTATLIAAARDQTANCLLFDNGDFLNGNALGDYLADTLNDAANTARLHPMIAAMNHLRYDAVTLGNHEFSHGLRPLMRSLRDATFPVVASNLRLTARASADLAVRSVILTRKFLDTAGQQHRLRIAVIGFLPPQTTIWEQRHLKGQAKIDDIVTTARAMIPDLRAKGADVIIALSHSGIGTGVADPYAENVSLALAAEDGIDVIIAGHTHLVFPTPESRDLAGKPAVMPGFFGSHLGIIDLTLQQTPGAAMRWQIAAHHAQTSPIAARSAQDGAPVALVGDDPMITDLVASDHGALQAWADQPIGHSKVALHSFFALLTQSPALDMAAMAQSHHLARALAGGPFAALPLLSAVAPFKAGGRGGAGNYTTIPPGPLLRRNAGDLYLHPNSLVGLHLSGQAILRWLERSVSLFHQVMPGAQDAALINPDFPSYDFDVIYGLTYTVDLTQPARFDRQGSEVAPFAQRIVKARYLGQQVQPDQMFVLATNSYRCAGGSGFARPKPGEVIFAARQSNQSLVENFIRAGRQVAQPGAPHWGFAPLGGTTVLFDCDPRAIAALADVPHLHLEPVMRLESGFHRFRLHL